MKEIIDKCIIDILGNNFDKDSDLRQDLGADDLDLVELAILIEVRVNIKIIDEEFEQIKTVNELYDYVIKESDK